MSRVLVIESDNPVSKEIGDALAGWNFPVEFAAGHVDTLHKLRVRSFGVVITSPHSTVQEDVALLQEMRQIRPGVKSIVLARQSTPEEVIAALRARVSLPVSPHPLTHRRLPTWLARPLRTASGMMIFRSSPPGRTVSVRVNCRLLTAERVITFAKELSSQLPEEARVEIIAAFREILLNAMEHGAAFNPDQVVEITVVRTARSMVVYVRDPAPAFGGSCSTTLLSSNT